MIKVSRAAYLGAKLTRASNDVRYYLNAIYFDPEGFIVATDGHRIFCDTVEMTGIKSGLLIDIVGKEPPKFDKAHIDPDAKKVIFTDKDGGVLSEIPFREVDGRFPDWRRVTGLTNGKVESIGLDMSYLADAAKIAKHYGVKAARIDFQDTVSAIRINLSETAYLMIMPARVK